MAGGGGHNGLFSNFLSFYHVEAGEMVIMRMCEIRPVTGGINLGDDVVLLPVASSSMIDCKKGINGNLINLTFFVGKTLVFKLWPLLDKRAKLDLKLTNSFMFFHNRYAFHRFLHLSMLFTKKQKFPVKLNHVQVCNVGHPVQSVKTLTNKQKNKSPP